MLITFSNKFSQLIWQSAIFRQIITPLDAWQRINCCYQLTWNESSYKSLPVMADHYSVDSMKTHKTSIVLTSDTWLWTLLLWNSIEDIPRNTWQDTWSYFPGTWHWHAAKKYFKKGKFWIVQVKKASHTTFFTSGLPSKFDHQLYKDEISYDLGFIAIGVVMAT